MRDPLVIAITEAINHDGPIYKSAANRHKDKPLNEINISIEQELAKHIAPQMMKEPTLKNSEKLMIRIGDTGGAMSFGFHATQLVLTWASQLGPTNAVQRIRNLLAMKEATGYHVQALAGLECHAQSKLPNDVELLPFEHLPDSLQKRRLVNRRFDYMEFGFVRGPTAALRMKRKVKPLFYESSSEVEIQNIGDYHEIFEATRLCVGLVGPIALMPLNTWFQYEDEILNAASGAGGISYPAVPRRAIFNIPTPQEFNPMRARKTTKAYFNLPRDAREIITRAMQRLDKVCASGFRAMLQSTYQSYSRH